MATPLAEEMRPTKLSDFIGQEHIVGPDGIISKLLTNQASKGFMPSLVFWGPPGCGKTTLARIIATELKREFFEFSAVNTSSKEITKIIGPTSPRLRGASPIIFVDEIHRFNKAQQDRLLPHVEKGEIILIGATTENPSFSVISPLLSRCRVVVLKQLEEIDLTEIANKAIKKLKIKINKDAKTFLLEAANGDARVLLNTMEIASQLSRSSTLLLSDVETALQRRQLGFDKQGDEFYNVISAFIKSMRASDVNAALYYLARMVEAGHDPLYIARRMVVFASEDVASPTALVVANAVFAACQQIGYPECQENLAAGVVYLATAKKDRSSYDAYMSALNDVRQHGNLPVPLKIRNPVTKLMSTRGGSAFLDGKSLDYGKDYKMYDKETLLPEKLKCKKYYNRKMLSTNK
jgi:putative ATPase